MIGIFRHRATVTRQFLVGMSTPECTTLTYQLQLNVPLHTATKEIVNRFLPSRTFIGMDDCTATRDTGLLIDQQSHNPDAVIKGFGVQISSLARSFTVFS